MQSESSHGAAGTALVLVVDDDDHVREAIMTLLRSRGLRVAGCATAREGLFFLKTAPRPDLILLDLIMPEMDGWEFRVAQKRDSDWRTIPVIVLSADSSAKAAAVDADAYLPKPINAELALGEVERLLQQSKLRRQLAAEFESEELRWLGDFTRELSRPLRLANNMTLAGLERAQRLLVRSDLPEARQLREVLDKASGATHMAGTLLDAMQRLAGALTREVGAPRRRVLVIDDDPATCEILTAKLAGTYDVHAVCAPDAALRTLLEDNGFDLVLCRVWMDELSGSELYHQLLTRHPEQARRVVFVVSDAADAQPERIAALAGRPLLRAPFDLEQLHQLVRQPRENVH
jgi:CheY-like chemotaxis protein